MAELSIEEISKSLLVLYNEETKKMLKDISEHYGVNYEELLIKYVNSDILKNVSSIKKKKKKTVNESTNLCMARKQDGNQCTRRRKDNGDYCGKHITNRKYGRIDDHSEVVDKLAEDDNYIMTWIEEFNGKEYLVDGNNIIYTKDVASPKIVGKKVGEGIMEHIQTISPLEI